MATVTSRHHGGPSDAAERYGKHSRANARGLSVRALLERWVERGEAIRLAWRAEESDAVVARSQEFPTAVLPVIRGDDSHEVNADEDTEPTTTTRQARNWLQSGRFEGRRRR